ncbi:hypothetical protein HRbin17_01273 [bacterium HR17]|uniref:DUF2059 domain-containing protein n=1 Tax=Candidatus Fervidibacter japonicus TaxID=2035412 RepID=A0A2H5XC46_9BACT|nr:hypothetical protein HRbin17_01273 [bacterium HR17]
MQRLSLLAALMLGGVIGFVAARQAPTPEPPSPMDEFIAKIHADLDASGQQVVMEVWTGLQLLKEAVKRAPVQPAPMPDMEARMRAVAERIGTATAVTLGQAFLAAFEKSVVAAPELENFVLDRVAQFFKVDTPTLIAQRKKGWTWTGLIVGYGIAKAANKPAEAVFALHEKTKSWAKVAVELGLKPEALGAAVQGLFP